MVQKIQLEEALVPVNGIDANVMSMCDSINHRGQACDGSLDVWFTLDA